MNNKIISLVFLVIMFCLSLSFAVTGNANQLVDYGVSLSAQQRQDLAEQLKQYQAQVIAQAAQAGLKRNQLKQELLKDKVDEKQIDSLFEEIAELEKANGKAMIRNLIKVKTIIGNDNFQKYLEKQATKTAR